MNAISDYILKARPDCDLPEVFLTVVAPHRPLSTSGIKAWFESACERAGVEKIPGRAFHSIRRAFETVTVSRGVPIETASQLLGHASIEEDKPYITYDRERVSSVSMDFGGVPILHGTYADRRTGGGE
jgi:site-specific recombinase XerD